MYLEKAIRDAVEKGGWHPSKYVDYTEGRQVEGLAFFIATHMQQMALLDPAFWQALGKARGWDMPGICCGYMLWGEEEQIPIWKGNWHQLIDHLASGGTVEEFFTNLEK